MDKKSLLIQILQKLSNHRDMANVFLLLIEKYTLSDDALNWLIDLLGETLQQAKSFLNESQKKRYQQWLHKLKTFADEEKIEHDEADLLIADL